MNQFQSREEKWYRASTVFTFTSRRTRNCNICMRTKTTRAPCRKHTGTVVPRAENVVGLVTADHKVLCKGCESRNNHRYAAVMQDLATQWIQSYPCKTKTSQNTEKSLQKFWEPMRKLKVVYTHNSLEFGKSCEDLSWNHCASTPHVQKLMGLLRERYVGLGKGLLLYCCNEVWMKNGGRIPWSVIAFFETYEISCLMVRHLTNGDSANHMKDEQFRLV